MFMMRAFMKEGEADGVVLQMIAIINNLIRKRQHSTDTVESQSVALSSLAAPLIGNIASYLHQQDHARFGLVSRSNYIGCNTPNTLRDLNLSGYRYRDESLIDIRRFSHLRSLRLYLKTLNVVSIPSAGNICRHLTKLEFDNERDCYLPDDFDEFMELQSINFSQITHLTLRNFSTVEKRRYGDGFRTFQFVELLSLFPNLQYLHLYAVYIQPFRPEQLVVLKKLLRNLEVFVGRGQNQISSQQIITAISKQLKAIRGTYTLFNSDGLALSPLEEISVAPQIGCSSRLEKIRRNGSALKRVCLDWSLCKFNDRSSSPSPSSLIPDLISKESELEQLVIGAELSRIKEVCTAIDNGIAGITKERYGLQIKLWIENGLPPYPPYDAKMVINCIYNVVDRLLSSPNIEHFVFIWRFWDFENKIQYQEWKKYISEILERGNSFDVSYDARNIVITNKGCKLEGQIQNYMTDDWMTRDF